MRYDASVLANPAAPRVAHQMALSELAQQNVPTAVRGSPLCQREGPPLHVEWRAFCRHVG